MPVETCRHYMDTSQSQTRASELAAVEHRGRLRFSGFKLQRSPHGACRVEVELEWLDGAKFTGVASGQSSSTVDLRVAADAALRAIEQFSEGGLEFELIGVKHVRAFDANVIIVAVANKKPDGPRRLLGATLVEDDPVKGAAMAVLGATNRVLGNFVQTR